MAILLRPAAIFSNDMVLQRGKTISLWGLGKPGESVIATLCGKSAAAPVQEDGSWSLTLPVMPAGGPYTLNLCSGSESVQYERVYLGDVWLAGGQSNMELELQNSENGKEELAHCHNPRLHFYNTPKVSYPGRELDEAETASHWCVVAPDTAATMSAVAYYAGKQLTESLAHSDTDDEVEIHIGILDCYWGGTSAACWTSRDTLCKTEQGKQRLAEYEALVGGKTEEDYDAELTAYNAKVQRWNEIFNALKDENPQVSMAVVNEKAGQFPWPPPAGTRSYQRPGNLYESMLRRVCPYTLCGFWYYQGEQDEEHADDYAMLLHNLIAQWRADWRDTMGSLPFYIVQLPMYGEGKTWPVLRAAQSRVSRETAHSGLVVLADCGEQDNIHPVDKVTPGVRLALLTLEQFYRKKVVGTAPRCTQVHIEPEKATAYFACTGGQLTENEHCKGFEVKSADGNWIAVDATIEAECAVIRHADICGLRYAWCAYGPAELHGGTGLAAEPFCYEDGRFK